MDFESAINRTTIFKSDFESDFMIQFVITHHLSLSKIVFDQKIIPIMNDFSAIPNFFEPKFKESKYALNHAILLCFDNERYKIIT